MAIVTKRHKILNVNGTDELFQVPDSYLEGSLWAFVELPNTSASIRATTYFEEGFFSISPAPVAGSNLYLTYDTEVVDTNDPLNFEVEGITLENIVDIVGIIKTQQETLKAMDTAIQARVGISQFNTFAEILDQKIRKLEALV